MSAVERITIKRCAELTGYTVAAIRTKIRKNVWPEGEVWCYAPDHRQLIIVEGYNQWADSGSTKALGQLQRQRSKSTSTIRTRAAANVSNSSPLPLI